MYNILNSISFLNLYTELATVIRLAVVVMFSFFFLIWHPDVYNCHNNNNNSNDNKLSTYIAHSKTRLNGLYNKVRDVGCHLP